MSREAIYTALFDKLKAATGITNAQRRYMLPDAIDISQMPCLLQVQKNEVHDNAIQFSRAQAVTHTVDVFVYIQADAGQFPTSKLNPLVDNIQDSLMPSEVEYGQTLGGLVEWCKIIRINYGEHEEGSLACAHLEISFRSASC